MLKNFIAEFHLISDKSMSYLKENTAGFHNREKMLKIISVYCDNDITRKKCGV
jgi:hypothetical protein